VFSLLKKKKKKKLFSKAADLMINLIGFVACMELNRQVPLGK